MLSFWVWVLLLHLNFTRLYPFFRLFVHTWGEPGDEATCTTCLLFTSANSPMTLEIVYTVMCVWLMLADSIMPLTVSWLSWQWLPWQWLPWHGCRGSGCHVHTSVYLRIIVLIKITWPQATCLRCYERGCWNTWTWCKICLSCLLPV